MQSRVTLASAEGTGVGPRKNRALIRPAKASQGGTLIVVPSSLRLREVRPEKAVLSAQPDAFRVASGLKWLDPRLHSSTLRHSLNLAIPQCARVNPRQNRGNRSRPVSVLVALYGSCA